MLLSFLLSVALSLSAPLVVVEKQPIPTLISNVDVFTQKGTVQGPVDVVLENGKIRTLSAAGSVFPGDFERVINGRDHTLIPGLIDLHVHVNGATVYPGQSVVPATRRNLQAMLYSGVTTALDLGMPAKQLQRLQERIAKGRVAGPTIFGSGKPFTAPDGHPGSSVRAMFPSPLYRYISHQIGHEVADAEAVDQVLIQKPSTPFVKVMLDAIPDSAPIIEDGALQRLRLGANAFGARLVAHAGSPQDVQRAIELPVDVLAHVPYRGALSRQQAKALAEQGIPMIATLAVWEAGAATTQGKVLPGPLDDAVMSKSTARKRMRFARRGTKLTGELGMWGQHLTDNRVRAANTQLVRSENATVLIGSDSPNMGLIAGSAFHLELELHQKLGRSISEVLVDATWNASRFLDKNSPFGAVVEGWQADLILIEGAIYAEANALHHIRAVWTDGRAVMRREPKSKPQDAP